MSEVYKVRGAKYLIIDAHGKAHWSESPSSVTACLNIDKSKLVEWTEYLRDNVYIKVGNKVFRQMVGIPMENLFLFNYEYTFMKNLMRDM